MCVLFLLISDCVNGDYVLDFVVPHSISNSISKHKILSILETITTKCCSNGLFIHEIFFGS